MSVRFSHDKCDHALDVICSSSNFPMLTFYTNVLQKECTFYRGLVV